MASLPLGPGVAAFSNRECSVCRCGAATATAMAKKEMSVGAGGRPSASPWPWLRRNWNYSQRAAVVAMASYEVKLLMPDGEERAFRAPDDDYILETAEEEGVELPSSCRSGACSACCAKLVEGEVDQSDGSFLSDSQIKAGYVLTCVAYPLSNLVLKTHLESEVK